MNRAVLLGLLTAACWAGWMGWDRQRTLAPGAVELSGPYEAWQVVGCVLCLALLAAAAPRWLPGPVVVAEMSVVFTVAWSISAATTPTVGANLWPIGAAMVLMGMLAGTALVVGVVCLARLVRSDRAGA